MTIWVGHVYVSEYKIDLNVLSEGGDDFFWKASFHKLLISFDEIFILVLCQCGDPMDLWTLACIGDEVVDLFFLSFRLPIPNNQTWKGRRKLARLTSEYPIQGFTFTKETTGLVIHYNNTKASCDTKTYMTLSYISKPTKDESWEKATHITSVYPTSKMHGPCN